MSSLLTPQIQFEVQFLVLLLIAVIVAIAVKYVRLPYTIALVLVGMVVGYTGIEEIELSKDLILFIFLPVLLFEGAIHIDIDRLRENGKLILFLSFIGLAIGTFSVGVMINYLTGIPILYAALFGAMIMPTDPVSVLALFKKMGVSPKLTNIVEGESLFNDGTGIVLFQVILSMILDASGLDIGGTLMSLGYVVLAGFGIGLVVGYVAYGLLKRIDDHLIEVIITGILAYGSFILAESGHASGVMAVVAAGLLIGNKGTQFAMSPTTRVSILTFWEIAAFIVNSIIFLLIGIRIPVSVLLQNANMVLIAIAVVVFARVLSTYPLISLFNLRSKKSERISWNWQHVINWGGLHGSIPIALALGLPEIQYRPELLAMVFGVVLFSLVGQGLTIEPLIKRLKVAVVAEGEIAYEKLMTRKMVSKEALDTVKEMHERKEIPTKLYKELEEKYAKESTDLKDEISVMLEKEGSVELLKKQKLIAERKITNAKKKTVAEALQKGMISDDSASELLAEIDDESEKMGDV
jgi:monovalent cation:H+ antiporter, CPA1 family